MIRSSTFAALMLLTADVSLAQTTAPAPPAVAAPASPSGPASTPTAAAVKPRGGAVLTACRTAIDAKPLTGDQRKAEMRTCMTEHRDTCRKAADDAHIPAANGERRDYVRKCMQDGA